MAKRDAKILIKNFIQKVEPEGLQMKLFEPKGALIPLRTLRRISYEIGNTYVKFIARAELTENAFAQMRLQSITEETLYFMFVDININKRNCEDTHIEFRSAESVSREKYLIHLNKIR